MSILIFLVLFSWILTSSNRQLRDHCSKAIIALLSAHFNLCLWLLKEFETVDDPYVMQRLYGCVYGAVLKREVDAQDDYSELALYISDMIFAEGSVCQDILLRDYAYGIVTRWLYENPKITNQHLPECLEPPYGLDDLPIMEDNKERYDHLDFGAEYISWSMRPDRIPEPGGYGDFGRYVFQSAIEEFKDVDVKNAYLYAMDYIFNHLKYSNERFGEYDCNLKRFGDDRHDTRKIERIGKKYEWIAFYNTIARLSDNHILEYEGNFRGAWQLYIRDFDPTVSSVMLDDPVARQLFDVSTTGKKFLQDFDCDETKIVDWSNDSSDIFSFDSEPLIITDHNGIEWVKLDQYLSNDLYDSSEQESSFDRRRQKIWRFSFGYFVRSENVEKILKSLKGKTFHGRWFPEGKSSITIFNREYYWHPAFLTQIGDAWVDYEEETGEVKKIIHENKNPLSILIDYGVGNELFEQPSTWTETIKKKRKVCSILPAYLEFRWEGEYDSSQEQTTAFSVPCSELVEQLELTQKRYDGYFYHDDELVAFDSRLNGNGDALVIRKDYLMEFLRERDYGMFWISLGEKQFINRSDSQIWSEWSGSAHMTTDGRVSGAFWKTKEGEAPIHK